MDNIFRREHQDANKMQVPVSPDERVAFQVACDRGVQSWARDPRRPLSSSIDQACGLARGLVHGRLLLLCIESFQTAQQEYSGRIQLCSRVRMQGLTLMGVQQDFAAGLKSHGQDRNQSLSSMLL